MQRSFNPDDLKVVQRAFDLACASLFQPSDAQQQKLSRAIIDLAHAGERDASELARGALRILMRTSQEITGDPTTEPSRRH